MSTLFDQDMVARPFAAPGPATRQLAAEVRLLKTLLAERELELHDVWEQLQDVMHENMLLIDEVERQPEPSHTVRVSALDVEQALANARRSRWARAVAS